MRDLKNFYQLFGHQGLSVEDQGMDFYQKCKGF